MNQGDTLIAADGEALARIAAHLVRAWVSEAAAVRGVARVALSGGSTPRAMNRLLASMDLPWSATEWYWVDERFVPADSPRSNLGAARSDLFDRLLAPPRAIHGMPHGPSLDESAVAYEATLAASFGLPGPSIGTYPVFDLLLLGVGDDGHTASLFPGEPFVDVEDRWVIPVPPGEGHEARLTLSRPVIVHARRVVVMAQGASKRGPIQQARAPGSLREVPARLVREVRGELLWLLDAAAV
ncbi:MAG: 6-phosphogluconolactonase [Myxococcales bacterium]|nr:6-phosphogluconolactonase [Polyangiaceae bacterium]MDW8247947.1 6-phosphogluconolactonase [Myxococcales bacterium]